MLEVGHMKYLNPVGVSRGGLVIIALDIIIFFFFKSTEDANCQEGAGERKPLEAYLSLSRFFTKSVVIGVSSLLGAE